MPTSLGNFEVLSSAKSQPPTYVDRRPLSVDQWLAAFDAEGHVRGQMDLRRTIFYGVRAR